MNVRMVPLHEIKPYENNPKQHPVRQLQSIMQSIRQFGFRQPIVLDKANNIVCGHARYEAAATIGLIDVPCEIADNLTEQQIDAYRILDNEIAAMGYTDHVALNIEMQKLPDFDFKPFNLELPPINVLNEGLCDEEEVPQGETEYITKTGDIWILGNHRLMCGDSTMVTDVDKLMNGEKAYMIFTDPPFGINLETDYKERYGNENSSSKSIHYGEDNGIDLKVIIANSYCVEAAELFVWGADNYPDCLPRGGSWICWDKSTESIDGIVSDFELCWSREKHHYSMFRKLWKGVKAREETGQEGEHRTRWGHPTQKPIELATWFFDRWGKKAETILDFFGGSGSTLIACEKTNRKCFMMEISEHYCDIIVRRWQKFSGKQAYLESTGTMFSEVANA